MRILVFDDNETNRAAARAQLKGHDLTIVGTYDEAQRLLIPQTDHEKVQTILRDQFGDFNPDRWPYRFGDNEYDRAREVGYIAAKRVADEQGTIHPNFDVVLTDLLVPASGQNLSREKLALARTEMPIGIFICLLAAVRGRARYVAVFTDSNHHEHPASACFDVFNKSEAAPTPFTVEGSKVLLSNTRAWLNSFDPNDLGRPLEQVCGNQTVVRAKNWAALLDYLIA